MGPAPERRGDDRRARPRGALEEAFLALCHTHALPGPAVNARVGRFEVDFLWAAARLVVETDGARYHDRAAAHDRDRERDAELTLSGYRVHRFGWRQVTAQPSMVAALVRRLLAGP